MRHRFPLRASTVASTGRTDLQGEEVVSTPYGIRTRVSTMRGWRPRPSRRTGLVCDCARGGGLEPPITGPEPVVLPITPPPKERISIRESGHHASPSPRPCGRAARSRRAGRRRPAASRCRSAATRRTLDRARPRRRRHRVEPDFVRDVVDARRVIRVGDEHDAGSWSRSFRKRAAAASDCHDERPLVSRRIASSGTPCSCRYVGTRGRLGEAVAGLAPAGDDDRSARRRRRYRSIA